MVRRTINNIPTSSHEFQALYPFDDASNIAEINGNKMHYIDKGEGQHVVMIHGNPTWSFYFRNQIATLSQRFRTIAPDHIGCGFSDKPDAKRYNYTLASRIQDLNCLIRHLNINRKIHLVVHDWGGIIGLGWAVDHLDQIAKIVITNTAGFFLPDEKKLPFLLWLVKHVKFFSVPAVLGLNLFARGALILCSETSLPLKAKKGLLAPYNSWKNRIAILKFVQDIPTSEKDPSYDIVHHVAKRLEKLNESNLMFLWGAKDFVFDLAVLSEFKQRFPRAETHVFQDAGHYLFEDKPTETTRLIMSFLNR